MLAWAAPSLQMLVPITLPFLLARGNLCRPVWSLVSLEDLYSPSIHSQSEPRWLLNSAELRHLSSLFVLEIF